MPFWSLIVINEQPLHLCCHAGRRRSGETAVAADVAGDGLARSTQLVMRSVAMADAKLPIKNEQTGTPATSGGLWSPFETLRAEIDRLFDDFTPGAWRPFSGRSLVTPGWTLMPAVDLVEKDEKFEITAEIPGIDEKNLEVKVSNGMLTIRGEKQDEKEEKQKEYHVSERRYGSFQRSFPLPAGIDRDRIEAGFSKGILTVTLPKTADAQQSERKVDIKAA
jgi:HSP20 family protein